MNRTMTQEQARAWREGLRRVNELVIQEARAASPDDRLRDLEMLFAFAHTVDSREDDRGLAEVRRRWVRLKEQARAR